MTLLRKPITRKTNMLLDATHGKYRHRRIVVTLVPGSDSRPDLLQLRPERTRRTETISVEDCYRLALRGRVNRELLVKARERKAKRAERRERNRISYMDRKLKQPIASEANQ